MFRILHNAWSHRTLRNKTVPVGFVVSRSFSDGLVIPSHFGYIDQIGRLNQTRDYCYRQKKKTEIAKFIPVDMVVFDLDGTLLDTEAMYFKAHTQFLASRYKKKYTQALREMVMGRGDLEGAALIIKELDLGIPPAQYAHGVWQLERCLFKDVALKQGAEKIIQHLKRCKIPIAIATSSTAKTFKIKTQKYSEVFSKFCHVVLGDDPKLKRQKPHPDIFQLAASRFPKPPTNPCKVLVIEDSPNGVNAAKDAGMQVVMIPDSSISAEGRKRADQVYVSLEKIRLEDFGLPKMDW